MFACSVIELFIGIRSEHREWPNGWKHAKKLKWTLAMNRFAHTTSLYCCLGKGSLRESLQERERLEALGKQSEKSIFNIQIVERLNGRREASCAQSVFPNFMHFYCLTPQPTSMLFYLSSFQSHRGDDRFVCMRLVVVVLSMEALFSRSLRVPDNTKV